MKSNSNGFITRASVQALCGALIAVALMLAGYAVNAVAQGTASLTQPEKKVEVGGGAVSDDSFKFGEYNGLEKKGGFVIGNFDLRGGGAYDSGSTRRWRLTGTNLGLETRNLTADFAQQGKFRFNLGYDELLKNRSDSYQTPYQGAGTSNFTLPSTWLAPRVPQVSATSINFRSFDPITGAGSVYVAGKLTAPTADQLAAVANIRATDVGAFQSVDLYTKRTRFDAGFSFTPDERWEIPASFRYEHKEGYKWLGAVSSQVSEFAAILPDRVDQDTEQANAGLIFKTRKGFLAFGYYGSYYKNNVLSETWQDVNDLTKSATMATAPSNQFSQFTLTGGYNISAKTKLVLNGAYGRTTQDDAFLGSSTAANGQLAFGLPATSLNALVVSRMISLKLTSKPAKALKFTAAYKIDDRDNRTPINTYLFQDANESKSGSSSFAGFNGLPTTLGSNTNIYTNRAYSKQVNQLNLNAELALAKRQWIEGGYDWQRIDRSCNGSWINCADAPKTKESTLRAEWHANSGEFSARLAYAYSWRRVSNYDENAFLALVPMANVVPLPGVNNVPATGATMSAYAYLVKNGLTGFGPLAGFPANALTGDAAFYSPNNNILPQALYASRNNINELPGMRRYMVADRNRHKVRSSLSWQATDKFSLQGTGDYNQDEYQNSTYGLQKAKNWTASFDGTYAASETLSANIFYSYEDQRFVTAGDAYGSNSNTAFQGQAGNTIIADSPCYATILARNLNAKMDPCLIWSKDNRDKVDTAGITFKKKNLASGKLELTADVTYTRARTTTAVKGGSYVNNPLAVAAPAPPLAAGVPAVFYIPAADFPLVRNDGIKVRPTVTYAIAKSTSVRLYYGFQRLMATDYAYDGMQYGTGTNYLPTNEKAPNFSVHVVGFSLIHSF